MASNEALVKIFWEDKTGEKHSLSLPEPTAYSGNTSTLVDAGTSVSGRLLGSVVRNDVAQISMSWNHMEAQTWSEINQIFKDNYINSVRFFHQTAGGWVEREMYISDRSAGMWRRDSDGKVLGWTGCNLQLSEV